MADLRGKPKYLGQPFDPRTGQTLRPSMGTGPVETGPQVADGPRPFFGPLGPFGQHPGMVVPYVPPKRRRVAVVLCDISEVAELLADLDGEDVISADFEPGLYPIPQGTWAPGPQPDGGYRDGLGRLHPPMDNYVHIDAGLGVPGCLGHGPTTDHQGSVTCPKCLKALQPVVVHGEAESGKTWCGLDQAPSVVCSRTWRDVTCEQCHAMSAPIPTAPRPAPTGDVPVQGSSTFAAHEQEMENLRLGKERFRELVKTWEKNFNVEGAQQPDRPAKMMATFSGMGSGNTIKHIKAAGGLATAIADVLVEDHDPEAALVIAKEIALNMVQCGSVMAIPIQRWIEANLYLAQTPEERATIRPSLPLMGDMENEEARPEPIKPKV